FPGAGQAGGCNTMSMPAYARLFAMVPTGDTGTRMGMQLPKQYLYFNGSKLAEYTLSILLLLACFDKVVVATAKDDLWWPQLGVAHHPRVLSALGGDTRAASVLSCLELLSQQAADSDWVLVHDMARPCIRLSDIEKLLQVCEAQGAILAL